MSPLNRRAVCRIAAAALVAAVAGCGVGRYRGPVRNIVMAGGQPDGYYLRVAQMLAHEVTAAEPRLRCSALPTGGSVDNVEMVRDDRAHVAIVQSDIALAAVAGNGPFHRPLPVRGIGRMYEDYLQLAVLDDSPVRSLADLNGSTVSIGSAGSGTAVVGERLFAAAELPVTPRRDPLDKAIQALADRRVDAALWCGGVPTRLLTTLHAHRGIRLLKLDGVLPELRAEYGPAYQLVHLPAARYGHAGMPTVGVANLLLCARSLPADAVAAITAVLVERAAELVPPEALGTQFLDRRSLIGLLGVPMHEGAATTYRQLHG